MREAPLERAVGREVDALEDCRDALVHAPVKRVRPQYLAHVVADTDRRVQRRPGILRHIRDDLAE